MKTENIYGNDQNIFRDVFFVNLAMLIPPLNIACLVYWAVKKNKRLLKIGVATIITISIFITSMLSAMCIVFKVTPKTLFKNGRFSVQNSTIIDPNGYLEVGGRMLQISSEENLVLSYDAEKVILYTSDKKTRLVLYEDSGIEVGSLDENNMLSEMTIEDPADFFDIYNEKFYTIAEKIGINDRTAYVSYTQGLFENIESKDRPASSGAYTEVNVLQDVGAKTYLRIRIADYTGEAPSSLVTRYALTLINIIA